MLSNLCTSHARHVAIGQDMSNPVKASSALPRVPRPSAALWETLSLPFCWSPIMVTFASVRLTVREERAEKNMIIKPKNNTWNEKCLVRCFERLFQESTKLVLPKSVSSFQQHSVSSSLSPVGEAFCSSWAGQLLSATLLLLVYSLRLTCPDLSQQHKSIHFGSSLGGLLGLVPGFNHRRNPTGVTVQFSFKHETARFF